MSMFFKYMGATVIVISIFLNMTHHSAIIDKAEKIEQIKSNGWRYFNNKSRMYYIFKNKNGSSEIYLSCMDDKTSEYWMGGNYVIEICSINSVKYKYRCISQGKIFKGVLPSRLYIKSYKVYSESDPTNTIVSGCLPELSLNIAAKFTWVSPNQIKWDICNASWGYELFYSVNNGKTWEWFGNGGDSVTLHKFGKKTHGKKVLSNRSPPVF